MKNIEFYYDELITEGNMYAFCLEKGMREGVGKSGKYNIISWLNEEHQVLNEKEKEYLSAVIKPFRSRVVFIQKRESEFNDGEYIHMLLKSYDGHLYDCLDLPGFKKGTMYSGMELDSDYIPKELGL